MRPFRYPQGVEKTPIENEVPPPSTFGPPVERIRNLIFKLDALTLCEPHRQVPRPGHAVHRGNPVPTLREPEAMNRWASSEVNHVRRSREQVPKPPHQIGVGFRV